MQRELTETMTSNEDKEVHGNKEKIRQRHEIHTGGSILLEVGKREYSLSARFEGSYKVPDQRGANI